MPSPKSPKKAPVLAKVRARKAVETDRVLTDLLTTTEALTGTVNELVTGFNGMAEDVAALLARTQTMATTVETLAKAGSKWTGFAEDTARLSRQVQEVTSSSTAALGELAKIAEANARVLEELRKRMG